MTNVTAKATRSGTWWAVEVPEIPGLFTQARRLEQVEAAVEDAAGLLGHPDVTVTIEANLAAQDRAVVETAKQRRASLREAETESASASRAAVARLRSQGFPVRDVATLLGVSPQRVSAIAA